MVRPTSQGWQLSPQREEDNASLRAKGDAVKVRGVEQIRE
jgi:hypothetical protein